MKNDTTPENTPQAENTTVAAPQPAPATPQTGDNDILQQLLQEQKKLAKKTKGYHTRVTVLLLALVVIFGIGIFSLVSKVNTITEGVPQMVDQATEALKKADTALTEISKVDFDGLNGAIDGISNGVDAIDFEGLNKSIEELGTAADRLAKMLSIFG